ncbi:DUF6488 family protein [Pseudomonadota bacterium]
MHKFKMVLFLCAVFFGAPVLAGSGHDHDDGHGHSHGPVSSDVASEKAIKKVGKLAQAGKIDGSWAALKPVSVEQKTYSQGPEWVITFKNEKISDTSKQTMYLFFSLDGHYIAANYTGN